jgi:hypothetical protein
MALMKLIASPEELRKLSMVYTDNKTTLDLSIPQLPDIGNRK